MINKSVFVDSLKLADIITSIQKDSGDEKENHRIVSILSNLFKIQNLWALHVYTDEQVLWPDPTPLKYQFGFRKGYSA